MGSPQEIAAPPAEVKILSLIEAFAGISYIFYILRMPALDMFLALPLAMSILSFWIAYGLYKIKRLAWFLSMGFSLLGLVFGGIGFILSGITIESALLDLPKLLLDLLTIALLLVKDVRKAFRI